jgi:hypothetical protein
MGEYVHALFFLSTASQARDFLSLKFRETRPYCLAAARRSYVSGAGSSLRVRHKGQRIRRPGVMPTIDGRPQVVQVNIVGTTSGPRLTVPPLARNAARSASACARRSDFEIEGPLRPPRGVQGCFDKVRLRFQDLGGLPRTAADTHYDDFAAALRLGALRPAAVRPFGLAFAGGATAASAASRAKRSSRSLRVRASIAARSAS